MLVLLSAPRGRVSAARVVVHIRERERAEARLDDVRPPEPPAESALPAPPLDGSHPAS